MTARLAVVAVLVGVALLPVGRADAASTLHFGFNGAVSIPGMTEAESVARLTSAGADTIRLTMDWSRIQREGPDHFDWSVADRAMTDAREAGLKVIAIPMFAPRWTWPTSSTCIDIPTQMECRYPPSADHLADYGRFVQLLVSRYARDLRAVEIWNEPNSRFFWNPGAEPDRYADLLCAGYLGARRIDATVPVLLGGVVGVASAADGTDVAAPDFLRRVYERLGGRRCADGVAIHPYTGNQDPAASDSAFQRLLVDVATVVDRFDPGRALWITEFGMSTAQEIGGRRTTVDEATQAVALTHAMQQAYLNSRVAAFVIHQLSDEADSSLFGTSPEAHWGLLRFGGASKAAFDAVAAERRTERAASIKAARDPISTTPKKAAKRKCRMRSRGGGRRRTTCYLAATRRRTGNRPVRTPRGL